MDSYASGVWKVTSGGPTLSMNGQLKKTQSFTWAAFKDVLLMCNIEKPALAGPSM